MKNIFRVVLLACFSDLVGLSGLGYRSLVNVKVEGRVEGRMSVTTVQWLNTLAVGLMVRFFLVDLVTGFVVEFVYVFS